VRGGFIHAENVE